MKERPILFSGPMVRALLDGSKTQTRRVVKWLGVKPGLNLRFSGLSASQVAGAWVLESPTRSSHEWRCAQTPCPFGVVGDRLWVRETFAHLYRGNAVPGTRRPEDVAYKADGFTPDEYVYGSWKPSIHMPRWASRITLEVTGVRVERLRDISAADCLAEGIPSIDTPGAWSEPIPREPNLPAIYKGAFFALWESINGAESWDANPWVWVVEFKRVTG